MKQHAKGMIAGILSYVIWGSMPLYWNLLGHIDALSILANRVVWSAVFALVLLKALGKLKDVRALFADRKSMRYLLPAALIITLNWGLYIWAVNNGHMLDASLGYYMNPLINALLSVILFKERMTALEIASLLTATVGVAVSTVQLGAFPWIAVGLAATFAAYGAVKKLAHADPIASIAVETVMIMPLALGYIVITGLGTAAPGTVDITTLLLFMGAGVLTASPLMLYAYGVNEISFLAMGFFQFISPTLVLFSGLIAGETMTKGQLVSFAFIWAGLILFVLNMVLEAKKHKQLAAKAGEAPAQAHT